MFERILYQNIDLHGMIYLTGLVNELVFHLQTTFSKRYRLIQNLKMLQADKSLLSLNASCPKAICTTMDHNNLLFCART